jgi:hypothetical protein
MAGWATGSANRAEDRTKEGHLSIRSNTVRTALIALLTAGVAALLVVLLFPTKGETAALQSPSPLVPLAADWDFDGESSTETLPGDGGEVLYERSVSTPAGANTLFITFSGTGDQHDDAQTLMTCWVDNHPCNSDEWVVLQYYEDQDYHDNNINYTWCKSILPGARTRNVRLNLASSNGGTVYVEQMHFYVTAGTLPHPCREIQAGGDGGDEALGGHGG